MKKCTLCIDRIYNENLAAEERVPACVAPARPRRAHFGDLGDPNSAVSNWCAERGGYRSDAGDGLQAGQQISAAAAAAHRSGRARRPPRSCCRLPHRRRRRLLRLDRPSLSRLIFQCIPRSPSSSSRSSSGAGYGLLAWLGALTPPSACCRAIAWFGVAVDAARAGARSAPGSCRSTFHLGHPERAWRAFSQWRQLLAVARRRGFGGDLHSQRRIRRRLGRVCDHHRAVGGERSSRAWSALRAR